MKELYQMSEKDLCVIFETERKGLTEQSAKERLEKYGENELKEGTKKTAVQIFAEQFKDLLVAILIAAAIISMFSGNVESTIVIFAVIILNAILGTVQYLKAEKSLDSLKALSSPHAKVLRNGVKTEVLSKEVVPGDILLLEAGDMVAADARILNNYSLQVNESSLTGESANVDKTDDILMNELPLADRINMVYSGTLVTYGRAAALVTGTGMNTEMGKIADLMNATQEKKTPLQVSLDDFSKKLAVIIICICIVVFGLQLYQGQKILDSLMFAVALAVAAIPEALSSIVTIVQAMGTQKMAKDNAIIKELKAVESLGCVNVICSDKTGTLTQNKMTVTDIYVDQICMKPDDIDIRNQIHRYLLYNAVLNNDSVIQDGREIGDPTEACLLTMAAKTGISEEVIRDAMPRMEELPFDSERKLMSTKYRIHGIPTVLTKGAVDVLIDKITHIAAGNGIRKITEADKENILAQNQKFSENGLRILAFAYREVDESEILTIDEEKDYTFIGLAAMIDPPREESKQAVADAKAAGIKTVMITGDHKVTAAAIGKQLGIFCEGDMAVTGPELDAMSDEELDQVLEKISVYARVSPENKIRIVDAWQKKGAIAAMTGDGVNDAPALKKADIGVAMGITGTEVSKDASSMILSDDNFATIIKAVLNGRNVYRNIKNAILFLLSGNTAGILVVLYCCLRALPTPFEPVHLLFINLLTDSLPALAIGMEPTDKNLLKDKPRAAKAGIMTKDFVIKLMEYGVMIAIATITAFYMGLKTSPELASTMAFATLTMARLFHGFNCRSNRSIFRIKFATNKWSIGAFFLGVLLLAAVLFLPFMEKLFLVERMAMSQAGIIVGLAVIPTILIQTVRSFQADH
ncbi:MAG: cation-translocating P-type ATPase [Clostridiales bacterium]|nr:cation-translocating P-type ATPase [Clostridiales bacterium]